jgi:hypothetical protein
MSPRNPQRKQGKRRGPRLLDEVLERRVWLYMLAAGATLAGASAAEAKVVFTPSSAECYSRNGYTTVEIDLNNDGTNDFALTCAYGQAGSNAFGSGLSVAGATGSNVTLESAGVFPAGLKKGAPIGSSAKFGNYGLLAAEECSMYGCVGKGNFNGVSGRILGVRFQINGEAHYGWIGFRYASAGGFTLLGWAYETQPNTHLLAGRYGRNDSELDSATLGAAEPTSLELLAAGHVAMADWRRRSG